MKFNKFKALRQWISICLIGFYSYAFSQQGFVENNGQLDKGIFATASFDGYKLGITDSGFSILIYDQKEWASYAKHFHTYEYLNNEVKNQPFEISYHQVKYQFLNANWSEPIKSDPLDGKHHFFKGNKQEFWANNVQIFEKLLFTDIYPHIDLELLIDGPKFKYNFILHPKANPDDIVLKIEGAPITVKDKTIEIHTSLGVLQDRIPISYWLDANGHRLENEEVNYQVKNQLIYFKSPHKKQRFNKSSEKLVIDPELVFATYSGSTVDNFGFTATYDEYGNGYAGGISLDPVPLIPGGRFPATAGAFSVTYSGGEESNIFGVASPCDITISKYSSDGSQLLYATYLGGNKNEHPHSLVVDNNGNLVIMGTVYSNDFPVSAGAYNPFKFGNSSHIFVSKLSSDGSQLLGSTYIGGADDDGLNSSQVTRRFYADDFRGEVLTDRNGNIYVASVTKSANFPTTNQAFQKIGGGGQDGVVFSFNANLTQLRWSSYLGGGGEDAIYTIDFSSDEKFVYVSGGTNSSDLPKTNGAYRSDIQGNADGFIAKITADGRSIDKITYLGTTSHDQIFSLELDKYGDVFVIGQSLGSMPVTGNVYQNAGSGQFICKLDSNLSTLLLSNVFGSGKGIPDITINAFLVDECGKVFVSGWGADVYRPSLKLSGMPITNNAVQRTTDGNDFYLCVFAENLGSLVYGSYLGGNRTGDHVDGGTSRFDRKGVVYQSVCASCPSDRSGPNRVSDFPTTSNAFSKDNPSPRCSNVLFKFGFENLNNKPHLGDTLFEIAVLDTLNFQYEIKDPDNDTIFVSYNIENQYQKYFTNLKSKDTARASINKDFQFIPWCELIGDTLEIAVDAKDLGCPFHLDSFATIRIVILPLAVLPPPEVICLSFAEDDQSINILWEGLPETRGFKSLHLQKIWPDGREERVRSFNIWGSGSFNDIDVVNPRNNTYQYYFVVENICGSMGAPSYFLNTTKEGESPVFPTYIETVTVSDSLVKIIWLKSVEEDFKEYLVYRRERGSEIWQSFAKISNINDTALIDRSVNVSKNSFCYAIRVKDLCENVSDISNYGCNIVLKGRAQPFEFIVDWQFYEEWKGDVKKYEIFRSVDTGSLRFIATFPPKQPAYLDTDLDYDWGGYWYQIRAFEGVGSRDAISESNKIYLIQPPLLWVPNAVTSNDDWLNDDFGWSDVFVFDFNMKIFNRWGEKVFETTDKNARWDGKSVNSELKESTVYVWIATYTGWDRSFHTQKGTVTILR